MSADSTKLIPELKGKTTSPADLASEQALPSYRSEEFKPSPQIKELLKTKVQELKSIMKAKQQQQAKYLQLKESNLSLDEYYKQLEKNKNIVKKIINDDETDTCQKLLVIYELSQKITYLQCAIDYHRGDRSTYAKEANNLKLEMDKIELAITIVELSIHRMEHYQRSKHSNAIWMTPYELAIKTIMRNDEGELAGKFMDNFILDNEEVESNLVADLDIVDNKGKAESSSQREVNALLIENERLNRQTYKELNQSKYSASSSSMFTTATATCRQEGKNNSKLISLHRGMSKI